MKEGSGLCQVFFVSVWWSISKLSHGDDSGRRLPYASAWRGEQGVTEEVGCSYMIVYRLEDSFWRYQQPCHLPYGHLEVHLGELEESVGTTAQHDLHYDEPAHTTDLLKNLGIRISDLDAVGVVLPNCAEPP